MCVVSMVHDHFHDRFRPWIREYLPYEVGRIYPAPGVPTDKEIAEAQALIDAYRTALGAARTVDTITKQPDCEDPEKAKLEARVAELEKQLASLTKKQKPTKKKHKTTRRSEART